MANKNGHIEIERGIELKNSRRGKPPIYPWKELKVGESFVMPSAPQTAHASAWRAGRMYGMKFAVRKTEGGARIWRVA